MENDTEFEKLKRRLLNNKWIAYLLLILLVVSLGVNFGNDIRSLIDGKAPKDKTTNGQSSNYAPFISKEREVALKGVDMFVLYTDDYDKLMDDVLAALAARGVSAKFGSPRGGYLCDYWGIGIPNEKLEATAETIRKVVLKTGAVSQLPRKRDLPIFTQSKSDTIYVYLCNVP